MRIPFLVLSLVLGLLVAREASAVNCSNYSGLSWCEDFDQNNYGNHIVTSSFGHLTHSHNPNGSWDGTGYAHFRINDAAGQDSAGYGGVDAGSHTSQFNVGFIVRFGSNFGPPISGDLQKHKDLLLVPPCWFSGYCVGGEARPMILGMGYCVDPGNCASTYQYRSWAPCSDAAAGCAFPQGEPGWPGAPGNNEPFKLEQWTNQWLYVEYGVNMASDQIVMYLYSRDGTFNGVYKTIPTDAGTDAIGGIDVLLGVWEHTSGTTAATSYDLDLVRIDNQFMGPPAGFVTGSSPDTVPPTVSSAIISASGTTLALGLSENVTFGPGGNGGLSLSCSSGARTAAYSSGAGTSSLVYTLNTSVKAGETCTRSYGQPGDGIGDGAGNDLASFSAQPVTNTSTQQLTASASAGAHGSISPSSRAANYGATTTFTIAFDPGYSAAAMGGTCGGSLAGTTYTTNPLTKNCTVTAAFSFDSLAAPTNLRIE